MIKKGGEIYLKSTFNLLSLSIGEEIKFYSKTKDLFGNEKIESYSIVKMTEGLYLQYSNANGFENNDCVIEFNNKIRKITSSKENNTLDVNTIEKELLEKSDANENSLRIGSDLMGVYEDGTEFCFKNILSFSKGV